MAKAKRNQSARKPRTTKPAKRSKSAAAPPVAAAVASTERQPTLPGVAARKSAPRHFALYLTDEQRELAEKIAGVISTPWKTATLNEAIRAAFLEGSQAILARRNAAKPGNTGD